MRCSFAAAAQFKYPAVPRSIYGTPGAAVVFLAGLAQRSVRDRRIPVVSARGMDFLVCIPFGNKCSR